jgi:glucosyl-3-phosphoglycerate phosphatase
MTRHRVVLVRHGESEWNAQGRWQGHGGAGLTVRGLAQAAATAAFLAHTEPDVVTVVQSDLQRVVETSAPAVAALDAPLIETQAWREIDVGWWSGLTHDEIADRDPRSLEAIRRGHDVARGGGETDAAFRRRIRGALADLRTACPAGTVVVFTHGGAIRAAAGEALGLRDAGTATRLARAENCSVTVLESGRHGDGPWRLRSYNGRGHLAVVD